MRMTRRKERGLTLIELLAVGTIVLILTVISLPMVKPMLDSQQTRSAAQTVSTYLNRAKSRAKLSGRPCGVRFEVWPGTESTQGATLLMRQVDVPPEYTGFTGGETVSLELDPDTTSVISGVTAYPFTTTDPFLLQRLADQSLAKIQFNNAGPYYRIFSGTTYIRPLPTCTLTRCRNIPFKVQLSPKPTMAAPMPLPQGAVVDLRYSGIGDEGDYWGLNAAPASDVTVMFSPSGEIDTINGVYPTGPIHLLIGRWDQIGAVRDETDTESFPNYADGRNYWVTVNPQSGLISTTEVNPLNLYQNNPDQAAIKKSREFASQSKRNIGGY